MGDVSGPAQPLHSALLRTGLVSLGAKGIGFAVPIAVAAWLGASPDTDALFLAYAVVFFGVGIWGAGLEAVALTQVARWTAEGDAVLAAGMRWAPRMILLGVAGSAVALGAIHFGLILPTVGASVPWGIGAWAFWLLLPMLLASGLGGFYAGALAARGHFKVVAASQSCRGLGALVLAGAFHREWGVLSLAVGFSVGECARWGLLRWRWARVGRGPAMAQPGVGLPPPGAAGSWRGGARQMTAVGLVGLAPLIERWVAGAIAGGGISHLDYAMRLFAIPSALFDTSVAAVIQSEWANRLYRGESPVVLRRRVWRLAAVVGTLATGMALVAWSGRHAIVAGVLGRGAFGPQDSAVVAQLFGIVMLGFPVGMVALILERAFLAAQASRALLVVAILKLVVRGGVAVIGGATLGLPGIAVAQPLSSVADVVVLGRQLRRHVRAGEA